MAQITFSQSYSVSHWGEVSAEVRLSFAESWSASGNKSTLSLSKLEFRLVGNTRVFPEIPLYGVVRAAGTTLAVMDNSEGGKIGRLQISGDDWCAADLSAVDLSSVTVAHDADGSKSVSVELCGGFSRGETYFAGVYEFMWASAPNELPRYEYVPFGVRTDASGTMALTSHPRQWTVSYRANGRGTAPAQQKKTAGQTLTLRGAIEPVTAGGAERTVTITGRANGGSWSGGSGSAVYTDERTVWTQTKWNTKADGSGTSYSPGGSYTADADLELYAVWTSVTTPKQGRSYALPTGTPTKAGTDSAPITVAFNANGGTTGKTSQTSTRRTSYTFSGWYTAAEGGTKRTSASRVTAAETVYAHYSASTGAYSSVTMPTAAQCTRTGYTLLGFAASASAASAAYAPGASCTPAGAVTYYAVWQKNSYTVSLTKSDCIASVSGGGSKEYGSSVTVTAALGSAAGYIYSFDGWYQGTTKKSSSLSYSFTMGAADLTLTAKATRRLKTYTVSYDARSGTGAPAAQTKTHGVALTLSSTKPTRANTTPDPASRTVTYNYHGGSGSPASATAARTTAYTFSKWNTASDGSGTSYNAGGSYTDDTTRTLYARYSYATATAAVTLPTPTRSGYAFKGWYTAETGGTKIGGGGASYTPSADITLHAQWTALASTIASHSASVETQGSFTLTVSRKSTAYYHRATFRIGGAALGTSEPFATSLSYAVPRTWFNDYPSDTQKTVTVSVQTYTDASCATAVGSADTATFTVRADSGMKPSCETGWANVTIYNAGTAASGSNVFVKGYSKAKVVFSESCITHAAGASTAKYSVTCQGVTSESTTLNATIYTPVLANAGTVPIVRKVTDSRGRTRSYTYNITVLDYAKPKLTGVSVFRCDGSGSADPDGTYISVRANGSCSTIGAWNTVELSARYKAAGGSWVNAGTIANNTVVKLGGGALSADKSYTVEITATDSLYRNSPGDTGCRAVVTKTVPSRKWAMKFRPRGNGVAFGKAAETDSVFEVAPGWTVKLGAGGSYAGPLTRTLTSLSEGNTYAIARWQDPDGDLRGGLYAYRSAVYGDALRLYHTKNVGGSDITHGLALYIGDGGAPSVVLGYPGAWRDALNVAAKYSPGDTVSFPSSGNSYYQRFHGDWRYAYALYFFIPLARSCEGLTATASGTVYVVTNKTRTQVNLSGVAAVDCFCAPGGVAVRLNWGSGSAPSCGQSQYDVASVQPYGLTVTFS